MRNKTLLFLVVIFYCSLSFSQPVNVFVAAVFGIAPNVQTVYEGQFGVGNVTMTSVKDSAGFAAITNYNNFDIIVINDIADLTFKFSMAQSNALVAYVNQGGHLMLSTEGCTIKGNGQYFMSYIWEKVTGSAITETALGQSGTQTPPRFHPSNGPWHLSPDPTLVKSTQSYASFGNVPPASATHQRLPTPPSCNNVEAVTIVYPSQPSLGKGTLYMTGEAIYPFDITPGPNLNHITAVAKMHKTLLTNDAATLTQLNTWTGNNLFPDVNLGSDTMFCSGGTATYTLTASNVSNQTYLWSTTETTNSISISSSGQYFVEVANSSGCKAYDTVNVAFGQLDATYQKSDLLCPKDKSGSITITPITGTQPYSFNIDGGATFVSSGTFSGLSVGTYIASVKDATGCQKDTIIILTEPNTTSYTGFEVKDTCANSTALFTDTSLIQSGGSITGWKWSFGDGNNATIQHPSHSYKNAGTYTVTLVSISSQGCTDTAIQQLQIFPTPTAFFTADSVCFGNVTSFQDQSSISSGGVISNQVWSFGDNSSPISGNATPNHLYPSSGVWNVNLIVSSNFLCIDDTTIQVPVYELPQADFEALPICLNQSPSVFTDKSLVTSGNIQTWNWNFGGPTSALQHSTYSFLSDGIKNVQLVVTTNNGCKDTIEKPIEIYAIPQTGFYGSKTEGCAPLCVDFTSSSMINSGNITAWTWDFGNGKNSTNQNPNICYENDGNFSVQLITISDNGCEDTLSLNQHISIWEQPQADFLIEPDEGDIQDMRFTFSDISSGSIASWNWQFFDNDFVTIKGNSVLQNPKFDFSEKNAKTFWGMTSDTGLYPIQLVVSTANGCTDTIVKYVKVNGVFYLNVPNAFTPNDDGVNDFFFPIGIGFDSNKEFTFSIYNRWGTLIFESYDLATPWDGTAKELGGTEIVQQDTYLWKLKVKDLSDNSKERLFTGKITLLR